MTRRTPEARHSGSMQDIVDFGANSAEEITKTVVGLPLRMLERTGLFQEAGAEVRRIQDGVIGAVYDSVREVNHRVCELARNVLAEVGPKPGEAPPVERAPTA